MYILYTIRNIRNMWHAFFIYQRIRTHIYVDQRNTPLKVSTIFLILLLDQSYGSFLSEEGSKQKDDLGLQESELAQGTGRQEAVQGEGTRKAVWSWRKCFVIILIHFKVQDLASVESGQCHWRGNSWAEAQKRRKYQQKKCG